MAERVQAIRHSLTRLGELSAHPGAFGVLIVYALAGLHSIGMSLPR